MIVKNKFLWIETNIRNFLFNFFSKRYQYKYRKIIETCSHSSKETFEIYLVDIKTFNNEFYDFIIQEPMDCLNCFEFLISRFIDSLVRLKFSEKKSMKNLQILLIDTENYKKLNKKINSEVDKLVSFDVNIVLIGKTRTKINRITDFSMENTNTNKMQVETIQYRNTFNSSIIKYSDFSFDKLYNGQVKFVEYQIIKAQENISEFYANENLKIFTFILERNLVDKLVLGSKYIITGVYTFNNFDKNTRRKVKISENLNSNKKLIIRTLGFFPKYRMKNCRIRNERLFFERNFQLFARSFKVYNWIYSLLIPEIYNKIEIKQGVACFIFGGEVKFFSNKYRSRGEINILLIGNDSKNQSRIFQFIRKITENATTEVDIYESKYYLENLNLKKHFCENFLSNKGYFFGNFGVLCIENFEKLERKNQLKILELFRDQIKYNNYPASLSVESSKFSIFLAVTQTFFHSSINCLNDKQIKLGLKFYSKFDLVFNLNESFNKDDEIKSTKHIMSFYNKQITDVKLHRIHSHRNSFGILKSYISFVRIKFRPTITNTASELLRKAYSYLRLIQSNKKNREESCLIRINLNKLESIIRLSKSLTRMRMSNLTNCEDVLNGIRIFQNTLITLKNLSRI
nr:minichromosome maintenance component complex 5-like protein [Cryptomonas sp.]